MLETPVSVADAPQLQSAVGAALNRSVERLRDVEHAAATFPGVVDAEIVDFVSGTTDSHPDILLQNRLHQAIDAKMAADIRSESLQAFAKALGGAGGGSLSAAHAPAGE